MYCIFSLKNLFITITRKIKSQKHTGNFHQNHSTIHLPLYRCIIAIIQLDFKKSVFKSNGKAVNQS